MRTLLSLFLGLTLAFGPATANAGTTPTPTPSPSPARSAPGEPLPSEVEAIFDSGATELATEFSGDAGADAGRADQGVEQGPPTSFAQIPACGRNDIESGIIDRCEAALTACGEPDVLQWWVYTAPYLDGRPRRVGEPGWTFSRTLCSGPDAIDPATPAYSVEDFRRLPLPPGNGQVEPPGDYVLVTMPTNVYATGTDPLLIETTLAGAPITVRATPARWSWDFGDHDEHGRPRDGSTLGPTSNPGAPYPALTHTHAYATRGSYDITMTTHYTGEYTLDGGNTWLPVAGEARVDSAPTTVQALAGHNVLVADPFEP